MKRCKSCMTRTETPEDRCPVCGMDPDTARRNLSPDERRVRRTARHIRFIAMLHLILAGVLIMQLGETEQRLAMAVIAIINLILAIGLIQYDYRAYRFAVICYFGFGMVNVISIQHGSVHLGGMAFALLAIYIVGNRTAKALFERRLPES